MFKAKFVETPFHSFTRNSALQELIHNIICDLKFVQIKGGKKYSITSIDNCTKYYYVYQLRNKDEALNILIIRMNLKINLTNK